MFASPVPHPAMSDVTRILDRVQHGDETAAPELLPLVYGELRKLAFVRMANEKPGQTLEETFEVILSDPMGAEGIAPPMPIRILDEIGGSPTKFKSPTSGSAGQNSVLNFNRPEISALGPS